MNAVHQRYVGLLEPVLIMKAVTPVVVLLDIMVVVVLILHAQVRFFFRYTSLPFLATSLMRRGGGYCILPFIIENYKSWLFFSVTTETT